MNLDLKTACTLACLTASLGPLGAHAEDRSYDGSGNNLANPSWGAAGSTLARAAAAAYDDGRSTPRGSTANALPNPRAISNMVVAQLTMLPNSHEMTDWVFQWGQFVDHDLDFTNAASPPEAFNIPIPTGDSVFDPTSTGSQVMPFHRSKYDPSTGVTSPREQINDITSYLDASMIYGSDEARALALRTLSGDGKLKTSSGNLLPLNTFGLTNGTGGAVDPTRFYVAGDERVNEQIGLTTVHTLMMREHNRLAEEIAIANPGWGDEEIFQRARKLVGAEIQVITFNEFLPALLGAAAPSITSTYDPNANAAVLNEFSTALFRVGHTMLSPQLLRVQNDGTAAPGGHVLLRDAFFQMENLAGAGELEFLLKGLASDKQQEVDMHVIDDVRDFLFGEPMPGGFDLASLNIQRGRDHGLPGYNEIRVAFGLPAYTSFDQITTDMTVRTGLETLYGTIDRIDAWIGALSEDHQPGAAVGPLIAAGLHEQFQRTRDGDRFWLTNDPELSGDLDWLLSTQLSDIIRRNTGITNLQKNVFFMMVPEPNTVLLVLLAGLAAVRCRRLDGRQPN
ncbi:peroxidase family protein [Accumulibacter sp.]|uniref:peroxidase family protein n=1 Tax=Accumulibacter sp. TaxID=2053492 RepID=UPI002B8377B4|nr:peroxidase family protein [Accumulibacter sp.]HRF07006.1 peroxidase family protein [Accumulibacter sp.]